MEAKAKNNTLQFIRTIYLSLAAVIGLIFFIIGASGSIRLAFEHMIFPVDNSVYYSYPIQECIYKTQNYADPKANPVLNTPAEQKACEANVTQRNILQNKNDFNRQIAESLAMLLTGLPVWILHFLLLQADWKKSKSHK